MGRCTVALVLCNDMRKEQLLLMLQVRGRAATLLLGAQMGQLPDASFLQGFAAATARRLSVLGTHDAQPGLGPEGWAAEMPLSSDAGHERHVLVNDRSHNFEGNPACRLRH